MIDCILLVSIFLFILITLLTIIIYFNNYYDYEILKNKYKIKNEYLNSDAENTFIYLKDILKNSKNLSYKDKKIIIMSFFTYYSSEKTIKINNYEKIIINNILNNLSFNKEKEQREKLFIKKLTNFINYDSINDKLSNINTFDIEARLQVRNILLLPDVKSQKLRDILSDAIKINEIDKYIENTINLIDNKYEAYSYDWVNKLSKDLKLNFEIKIENLIENNYIRTNRGKIIGLNKINKLKEIIFNNNNLINYLNNL